MPDATALLSFALAAADGAVDGYDVRQLVAAGVTLLQRAAPLVRALSGQRSAILLPSGPAFVTALAASDGHGAVLLDPATGASDVLWHVRDSGASVVFTTESLLGKVPEGLPCVLLDEAPRNATFVLNGTRRVVDLGSHHGLLLEGHATAAGRDEECVVMYSSIITRDPHRSSFSHRDVLANARSTIQTLQLSSADHCLSPLPVLSPQALVISLVAPLLAGARISTVSEFSATAAIDLIEQHGTSTFVGAPSHLYAIVEALEARGRALESTTFRLALCLCRDGAPNDALAARFRAVTGTTISCGYRLESDAT